MAPAEGFNVSFDVDGYVDDFPGQLNFSGDLGLSQSTITYDSQYATLQGVHPFQPNAFHDVFLISSFDSFFLTSHKSFSLTSLS